MDIKTRISEFWQAACKNVGGFFKKIGDFFKEIPQRFSKDKQPAAEAEAVQAPQQPDVHDTAAPETPLQKTGKVLRTTGVWLYRLRRFFMAIPVVWYAMRLASNNLQKLPEQVGLNLQATGEYAQMIDRNLAVYGPLGITIGCLALMFFSRRARYPWIISIFTLVLPWLIWITNVYPQ